MVSQCVLIKVCVLYFTSSMTKSLNLQVEIIYTVAAVKADLLLFLF